MSYLDTEYETAVVYRVGLDPLIVTFSPYGAQRIQVDKTKDVPREYRGRIFERTQEIDEFGLSVFRL